MSTTSRFSLIAALLLLGACTTVPSGPSVLVLPGSNKNFDQFRVDDTICRQYAGDQLGGSTPAQAANDSGARSAVLGTLLGAAVGAAVGGRDSAAIGAGTGLLVGGLSGTETAHVSARGMQQRYDNGYQQCMYAKGNRVPASSRMMVEPPAHYPPPPDYPPPGSVVR